MINNIENKNSTYFVLFLISIPIFIGALDLTVVSAVLPHVIYDLELPFQSAIDNASWLVSGYLLTYTIAIAFMGRLSDILGRRKVFLIGLSVFAIGSYLVATAGTWPTQLILRTHYLFSNSRPDPSNITLNVLIASRMIQAFGGGAMVPVGIALVSDIFPEGLRARPIGIIAAFDTAGWVVGHLYGGIITRFYNWGLIFWLNIPICIIAFILLARFLYSKQNNPRISFTTHDKGSLNNTIQPNNTIKRMDWISVILISLSLTLMTLGLGSDNGSLLSGMGQDTVPVLSLPYFLGFIVVLIFFIYRQLHSENPLIPIALFRNRTIAFALFTNFLIGVCLFIAIANVPLFINTVVVETLDQGAWDSGWLLSALTIPMAISSIPGGWLTEKRGYKFPSIIGILLSGLGLLLMTGWDTTTSYTVMIPQLMLAGIGLGLIMAPIATAVVNNALDNYRGISSALVIMFRLIGMSTGVSWMTTFGLNRAKQLTQTWLVDPTNINEVFQVAIRSAVKVVNETFLIAAIVCFIALIPVLFIRETNNNNTYEPKNKQ